MNADFGQEKTEGTEEVEKWTRSVDGFSRQDDRMNESELTTEAPRHRSAKSGNRPGTDPLPLPLVTQRSATGASRPDIRFVSERLGWLLFAAPPGVRLTWA